MVQTLGSGLCLLLNRYITGRNLPKGKKAVLYESSTTSPGMKGGRSICWRQVARLERVVRSKALECHVSNMLLINR